MRRMIQGSGLLVLVLVLGCSDGTVREVPAPVVEDGSAASDQGQDLQETAQTQPDIEDSSAAAEQTAVGEPVVVTDANFEEIVLRSSMPVLVDFWAAWCPPCKMLAPIIDDLAAEYQGRVLIAKLDHDENPNMPAQYEIKGLPTMVFFKNGQPVDRLVGLKSKEQIAAVLDSLLES
jgi:thioredoxin 1